MQFTKHLLEEIENYKNKSVETPQGTFFNEYKLKKRIYQFKNKHYPKGKLTERGAYKYYYDIITPRVNDELKNIRILPTDPTYYSISPEADSLQVLIANRFHSKVSKETGEDNRLNLLNSLFSEDGNVIVKLFPDHYEVCDPMNIYHTNILAEDINDTNIIEKAHLTHTELKKKKDIWDNQVIDRMTEDREKNKEGFTIYEYTGEISEADYNGLDANNKKKGGENSYFLAKVIISAPEEGQSEVLFKQKLTGKKMEDFYRHSRRGNYKGLFWGEGIYELLFDYQIRANEIGNQIARGLEIAATVILKATDLRTYSSIKTDLVAGDIINSADLQQVDLRMHGLDQLLNDWNRNIQEANRIANSMEIVYGGQLASRTPFKLGNLYNENANKYFGLLRQKLGHFYSGLIETIFKPQLLRKLSGEKIIILAGTDDVVELIRGEIVEKWYLENLVEIGPHTKEEAEMIKAEKLEEIKDKDITIKNTKEFWKDSMERIFVATVGENSKVQDNLQNIQTLLQFERDPARAAYLMDTIYKSLGIPLPPPPAPETPQGGTGNINMEEMMLGGGEEVGVGSPTAAVPELGGMNV